MSVWTKLDDLHSRVARQPLREFTAADGTSLAVAQAALSREEFLPTKIVVLGWEVALSRRLQDGAARWHLSAVAYPHGRFPSAHDRKVLCKIVARLDGPSDPIALSEDPRSPTHWSWTEA